MSPTLARLLIGGFLVAHGLIHRLYFTAPPPNTDMEKWAFHPDRSWLLGRLGIGPAALRQICLVLSTITIAVFVLAGISLIIGADWWRALTAAAAAGGLVLLILFWHPWLLFGIALNAAILILLWEGWPSASALGE